MGAMPAEGRTVELLGDLDRPGAWMLLIDGTPQSHVDLDDPRHLEFEYMRRLGHVVDLAGPPGRRRGALRPGGGRPRPRPGYTGGAGPGSAQLGVKAKAEGPELVPQRLPLSQPSRAQMNRA